MAHDARVREPWFADRNRLLGLDQPRVMRDQSIGMIQDLGWTSIALGQLYGRQLIVPSQVTEPLGTRSVPLVDDLVVVRDNEQIVPPGRSNQAKKLVLCPVRVLEFVDADVRPSHPDHPRYGRLLREQPDREMKQAAEVEPVVADERGGVAPEEQRQPVRRGSQRRGAAPRHCRIRRTAGR